MASVRPCKVVEFRGIDDIVWYFMLLGSIDTVEVILNDTGAWLSENWKKCFEIYTGALWCKKRSSLSVIVKLEFTADIVDIIT